MVEMGKSEYPIIISNGPDPSNDEIDQEEHIEIEEENIEAEEHIEIEEEKDISIRGENEKTKDVEIETEEVKKQTKEIEIEDVNSDISLGILDQLTEIYKNNMK